MVHSVLRKKLNDEKNNKVGKDIWFELPEFVRSTPDYIVLGKYVVFCEAKGYRKEKKIKESDFIVYKVWHKILPLFIYFRNFCVIIFFRFFNI